MKSIFKPILTLSAIAFSSLVFLSPIESASATTLSLNPAHLAAAGFQSALPVINVKQHRRSYDRRRHGPRFKTRRGRNRYYSNGYWYAVPFGIGALGAAGAYYDDDRDDDYIERSEPYRGGVNCAQKSRACEANWGRGGPDYDGCMRYEGC